MAESEKCPTMPLTALLECNALYTDVIPVDVRGFDACPYYEMFFDEIQCLHGIRRQPLVDCGPYDAGVRKVICDGNTLECPRGIFDKEAPGDNYTEES